MVSSYTSSESVTCLVPAEQVKLGIQRVHGAPVEARADV